MLSLGAWEPQELHAGTWPGSRPLGEAEGSVTGLCQESVLRPEVGAEHEDLVDRQLPLVDHCLLDQKPHAVVLVAKVEKWWVFP